MTTAHHGIRISSTTWPKNRAKFRLGEGCLISDDFAALLRDKSELRDLGQHELKGITDKRQVFGLA